MRIWPPPNRSQKELLEEFFRDCVVKIEEQQHQDGFKVQFLRFVPGTDALMGGLTVNLPPQGIQVLLGNRRPSQVTEAPGVRVQPIEPLEERLRDELDHQKHIRAAAEMLAEEDRRREAARARRRRKRWRRNQRRKGGQDGQAGQAGGR